MGRNCRCRVRYGLLLVTRFGVGNGCYRLIGQVRLFSGEYGTLDGSEEESRDGRHSSRPENARGEFRAGSGERLHCRSGPWLCSGADVGEIIVSKNAGLANRRFRAMLPALDGSRALGCAGAISAVSLPCSLTQSEVPGGSQGTPTVVVRSFGPAQGEWGTGCGSCIGGPP